MLFSLRHGTVHSGYNQNTCIHLRSTSYHVFNVIDMSRTVHVSVVTGLGLVLESGRIDSYTSGLLLRGLVYFGILDVLGSVLGS
jgi:hypothetical protein